MADEEKSVSTEVKKSSLNRYLIIGIVGLLIVVTIVGASIAVSSFLWKQKTVALPEETKIPAEATYILKEFLVSTKDNQGIIKTELELGLSSQEMLLTVSRHLGEIRDRIGRILVSKSLSEANESYSSGELHQEVLKAVNEVLEPYLSSSESFFNMKKKPRIVEVNFTNFLAK